MGNGLKRQLLVLAATGAGCLTIWIAYYLGGGTFVRGPDLAFTFLLSVLLAALVAFATANWTSL